MEPETTQPPEKRRIPRSHPRVRLLTQVEASSIGRTENISAGGMSVLTRNTFELQTEVIIRFNLPPDRSIEAQGVVVHAQPRVKMGIQFKQMKDKDLEALEEFVRQASEDSKSRESAEAS